MIINCCQVLGVIGVVIVFSFVLICGFVQEGFIIVLVLYDQLGGFEFYGQFIVDVLCFVVDEQNVKGGLLGCQIKLNVYDLQLNMQFYV